VFTYQGDGDFASIGLAESMHAALRGEKVTAICINNTTYGMTGGQGGPTTILKQVTTTTPFGRNEEYFGYPIKIAEQIALCEGTVFLLAGLWIRFKI
jgi:2-oxoglutarate/2-oxoacid ferredoxin oxidoreductase subunit beta